MEEKTLYLARAASIVFVPSSVSIGLAFPRGRLLQALR